MKATPRKVLLVILGLPSSTQPPVEGGARSRLPSRQDPVSEVRLLVSVVLKNVTPKLDGLQCSVRPLFTVRDTLRAKGVLHGTRP